MGADWPAGRRFSTIIFFLDDVSSISTKAVAAMCAEVPRRRRITRVVADIFPRLRHHEISTNMSLQRRLEADTTAQRLRRLMHR
jgi:hypothetical protein